MSGIQGNLIQPTAGPETIAGGLASHPGYMQFFRGLHGIQGMGPDQIHQMALHLSGQPIEPPGLQHIQQLQNWHHGLLGGFQPLLSPANPMHPPGLPINTNNPPGQRHPVDRLPPSVTANPIQYHPPALPLPSHSLLPPHLSTPIVRGSQSGRQSPETYNLRPGRF